MMELIVKPTGARCNLGCTYCFYRRAIELYPASTCRMSPAVLDRMVRQALAGGAPASFCWQGGEPTLMGLDFFRSVVAAQRRHGRAGQIVANSLQTNGVLLDDEWCRFFGEHRFLVGLSLDGPADVHDRYRQRIGGQGSHAAAERAFRLLTDRGVEVNVLAVVTDHAAARARSIYRYLRDLGARHLQFIPCVQGDGKAGGPGATTPAPEAYGRFLCELMDLWRTDLQDGLPATSIRTFDALVAKALGRESPLCIFAETCGPSLVVEHTGDAYACDFFVEPGWRLGNVAETTLRAMAASKKKAALGSAKRRLPRACESCRWLDRCHGGCPRDRTAVPATRGENYLCPAYRTMFREAERSLFDVVRRLRTASAVPRNAPPDPRVGRNDPCPCGSGRKLKRCCGSP